MTPGLEKLKGVLLIDDDSINNFINLRLLKSLEITEHIGIARDGEEALQFLKEFVQQNSQFPELIIIDLNMPGMDGFEFIERFTSISDKRREKSILAVLTTSSNPKDMARLKEYGIQYFFSKPLSKEDFAELLSKEFNYELPLKNTFTIPIIPSNERERMNAVKKYKIINSGPEERFNTLVEEAARFFNVPIALISIVDSHKVWFKGNFGMKGVQFAERGVSLCSLAILQDEVTVFSNAVEDPCLISNPLVHGAFGLKFYAGAPIINEEGYHIGTFCIVDKKPRTFSDSEKERLKEFALIAMKAIEERLEAYL